MHIKKTVSAALAGAMLLTATAQAKDNIYAYNKFISTVLGPQIGYCDIAASFAGHENEYDNVNNYFSGLISAFYDDIDADSDNELITVDTQGVTIYHVEEKGIVFLGSANHELIANYGDSYANVFTIPVGLKQYIGIERYGKTVNAYDMNIYELNPETDEFNEIFDIHCEDNEDGMEEKVWAGGKTYYSMTVGGGVTTSMNADDYADCAEAAVKALSVIAPDIKIEPDEWNERMKGNISKEQYKLTLPGISGKTYVRATGLRFSEVPVVVFEDSSSLEELKIKPDIVTVTVDGNVLQFPLQDPVIIEGRTLVPMRTIFEALGADVQWIDEDGVQSIVATTEETTINMTINSDIFYVNGEEKKLDVPAQVKNDKTLVPIRAISESLGCSVDWVEETKTVVIKSSISVPEIEEVIPDTEDTGLESEDISNT